MAIDGFGARSVAVERTVTVHNVAPTVTGLAVLAAGGTPLPDTGVLVDRQVTLGFGSFDPGDDTVTFVIDWGDGTIEPGAPGATHTYTAPNPATVVTVTATDSDGAATTSSITFEVRDISAVVSDVATSLGDAAADDPVRADDLAEASALLDTARALFDAGELALGAGVLYETIVRIDSIERRSDVGGLAAALTDVLGVVARVEGARSSSCGDGYHPGPCLPGTTPCA